MKATERTPLPARAVHIWRFSLISTRQEISALGHWLSQRENAALDRLVSRVERDKRIVAWGRLRFVLSRYLGCLPGDIQIEREPSGRPEIVHPESAGLRFNLAHSGSLGLAGISANAIGVDIEKIRDTMDVERLATRFFTRNESEAIARLPEDERVEAFFRVWVRKESYLKAAGGGVPASLSKCEVSADVTDPRVLATEFEVVDSPYQLADVPVHHGYLAALAVLGDNIDVWIYNL